jgi:HNH endonuclease
MAERLLARVRIVNDCWQWTGPVNDEGYARIRVPGHIAKWAIHRASYEVFVGPIPDGLTIDHLCRNPSCINPQHLEPVTMEVNIRRGFGIGMKNAAKTACYKGHPYVAGSYIIEQVGNGTTARRCIICRRERENRNYHEQRNNPSRQVVA